MPAPHRHRVDRDLASVVEVEHYHLDHVAGAVGPEDQGPQRRVVVVHVGDNECVSDSVQHVVSIDPVLARRAVELPTDQLYYTTSTRATLRRRPADAMGNSDAARSRANSAVLVGHVLVGAAHLGNGRLASISLARARSVASSPARPAS